MKGGQLIRKAVVEDEALLCPLFFEGLDDAGIDRACQHNFVVIGILMDVVKFC